MVLIKPFTRSVAEGMHFKLRSQIFAQIENETHRDTYLCYVM